MCRRLKSMHASSKTRQLCSVNSNSIRTRLKGHGNDELNKAQNQSTITAQIQQECYPDERNIPAMTKIIIDSSLSKN